MSANTSTGDYVLRVSRLTIDKLGIKLYDKVSAAVAELVANSYDADAGNVVVRLPLSTALTRKEDGKPTDQGWSVDVQDDGHGMTPDEAREFYLRVGSERRKNPGQGPTSRLKGRRVMGRKGIGKLAPFGICERIEVLSAGGDRSEDGYLVSHFFLDYSTIVADTDEPVVLEAGDRDRSYAEAPGTLIRLTRFRPKRVPGKEVFLRQLAARFAPATDFSIRIEDTRDPENNPPTLVEPLSIPVHEHTRIPLANRPVVTSDGDKLPVDGWLAMAVQSYKNEEMAGVRIYTRGKIAATTRDFEQPAGFTGEFTVRSYLVGEVFAEWLDVDDGEDLIRSDRQGILWDSEYGRALRTWGAELIKEIGRLSEKPRQESARARFLDKSRFEERAREIYTDEAVVEAALDLAKQIGGFAAEDELDNEEYVNALADVILSVAPHKALMEAFQRFNTELADEEVSFTELNDIFGKAKIAEMASFAQLASERVEAVERLEEMVRDEVEEAELQGLLSRAQWLIDPTWTPLTANQGLKTFKAQFEAFYRKTRGETVELDIGDGAKRPDFVLADIGHALRIVEIKTPGHVFDNTDFERLSNYVHAFNDFFERHGWCMVSFSHGWVIDLVADEVRLTDRNSDLLFRELVDDGKIRPINWDDFLFRTREAHSAFLRVREKMLEYEDNDTGD